MGHGRFVPDYEWENEGSRGWLPGFDGHRGHDFRFGDDGRIHSGSVHHPLDVEPLMAYPLIIVEKRERDGKYRAYQDRDPGS